MSVIGYSPFVSFMCERFGSIDTLGLMDGRIQHNHKVAKWRPNNAQIHACWLCA